MATRIATLQKVRGSVAATPYNSPDNTRINAVAPAVPRPIRANDSFPKHRRGLGLIRRTPDHDGHLRWHPAVFECCRRVVRHIGRPAHPTGDVSLQIVGPYVCNDSNDGAPALVVQEVNMFTDRVLVGPETPRGCRGDDRYRLSGDIGIDKRPAG